MSDLHLQPTKLQPWAPHPTAAPLSRQSGERLVTVSNGTRTSVGGWQIHYDGLQGGRRYRIEVVAEHDGVDDPRDMLRVAACWSAADPNDTRFGTTPHDNLLPSFEGPHRTRFAGLVEAPEGLQQLTIRTTLRWTPTGEVTWRLPRLAFAPPPEQAEGCRVAVVTGIADPRHRHRG